jgi:hypothetical protein
VSKLAGIWPSIAPLFFKVRPGTLMQGNKTFQGSKCKRNNETQSANL